MMLNPNSLYHFQFMSPAIKKWILWPLIILVVTIGMLVATGLIILSTQQQRLVDLVVNSLNTQIRGELLIGNSSISIFRTFPHVSIALEEGTFYVDKTKRGKPIVQFDRLDVGFSVRELIRQNYDIRSLILRGGYVEIIQEEDGTINLLKASAPLDSTAVDENADTTSVSLDLEKVMLGELRISFVDKANDKTIVSYIDRLTSSLSFNNNLLTLALNSDMKLDVALKADSSLFHDKLFEIDMAADYHLLSKRFEISTCNFKLDEAGFNVSGSADLSDTTEVNFRVKGDQQDFSLFSAFLPTDMKERLKPFEYDGRLNFDALVQGKMTDDRLPLIEVTFGCEEAWFLNTGANKKVDQLGFKGFYTNGKDHSLKTSEIHIINVNARPEKGVFKGHFVVRDFTDPQAVVKINSELELKFLGEFFGIQDLKQMTGTIKLDMDFKEIHDITLPEESLSKLKEGIQSRLVVKDLSFQIPGYPHAVKDVNIYAEMRDGRVTVDSASLKIGQSDLRVSGGISDVRAFLHDHQQTIKLSVNATSKQVVLSDLLSYDTALAKSWNEEVKGLNVSLALETNVHELLNPSPLPRGTFEMKNLRGTFKKYPHTFKDLNASVIINDTLLRLRDFTGMIDSSDINFKGRVINYQLWFADIKKGKTEIAFDFKSNRFALRDVFGREVRRQLPRGYRREELNNVWLRSRIDLRYDTNFRFAKAKIANVTADLKNHKLKLQQISGGVKYGSKILSFDTLRGKIGNSDFDISLKYYFKGVDRYDKKIANSLTFTSKFLDIDEMSEYDFKSKPRRMRRDSTGAMVALKVDSLQHAEAFNIFSIPFSDFNAQVDITKIKYHELWLKDVRSKLTMQENQTIRVDTLSMQVADGTVSMSGIFKGSNPEKIFYRSNIRFDQVNMEMMLLKLDHLGQDVVVNKNVKGTLSGDIRCYIQVHPDLVPIMSNSKAEMALTIYNGSLVDFPPMQAMASYFKDKNLRLIRFDTLENNLTFNKGVLDIPSMDINSSLGYMRLAGKQSLDFSMEYYVRLPMKMVTKVGLNAIFKRVPEEVDLNQIDEIEYLDKGKRTAFMNLKVTGTPDGNYDVGLGKQPKL